MIIKNIQLLVEALAKSRVEELLILSGIKKRDRDLILLIGDCISNFYK